MTPEQEKILERLTALVMASALSDDDKNIWMNAIKDTPPMLWEGFLSSLEGNVSGMIEATELLKQKIQALENGDKEMWKTILDNEQQDLEKLL
mgnify:FL=1